MGGVCVSGGCWEGIGDGLSMFVLVSLLSLFMVLYLMCVYLILTFRVIMLSSCFGDSIATHRLSKCKSPHHDYRGICYLR